jgi:hypothetical protein
MIIKINFLKKITFLGRTLLSNGMETALCDHFGIEISDNIVCVITKDEQLNKPFKKGTYKSVNQYHSDYINQIITLSMIPLNSSRCIFFSSFVSVLCHLLIG